MPLRALDECARRVARQMQQLGARRGDRIGVMAANCIEWVVIDLAILKLGAVTIGFDVGRFDATIPLERYDVRLMFVERGIDHPQVIDLATVAAWMNGTDEAAIEPLHEGYAGDDIFAIKFTSGSTGPPKGMEASVAGVNDSLTSVQEMFQHRDGDNILVFLRLAQLQQRYWCYSALAFGHDVTITNLDDVIETSRTIEPTVIMGVPGFFDDLRRRIVAEADYPNDDLAARRRAIDATLGSRIRYLWTGSAPATRETLLYFDACGLPLYQGYGLNETCIIAKNCPGANRIGSVGRLLPNMSARLDSRGVLIVKAQHAMVKRYIHCKPGDNERLFLESGEIMTNDLARFDDDGFLYILGRADDLVVLTTGRNVLVAPIEERLKAHPDVHDCVVYGHGRPFLTALISPAPSARVADLEAHVRGINATLFPEQQVKRVVVAHEPFSIDNGMLTSQFKPLRHEICRRLSSEIERAYAEDTGAWLGAYGQ
jgi:long-chain acyl-CoA synthetase